MELIEKIRAEVERLKGYYRITNPYDKRAIRVCENLLSFLDTLQVPEMKPDEELKNASEEYCPDDAYPFGPMAINLEVRKAFIAGAKWQKEQMMKDGNVILAEEDFDAEKEKSMEWGYNLCKEQMMKEAVEGEIEYNYDEKGRAYYAIRPLWITGNIGDKVRVIILKKDEK